MKYFKIFVVIVLSISLFINFNLLSRLGNLESRVNSVINYQQQISHDVNSQTNNINNVINDMKREQSWLSPINTNIDIDIDNAEVNRGIATLSFDWQIKEFTKNSEVVFNYKYGDNTEYTSINPVEKNNGLFQVTVPIEVALEPEWHIMVMGGDDMANEKSERAIEKKIMEQNNQSQFSYFITVSHDDVVKSGEINTTYIGNLGTRYYGALETIIDMHNENFNVSVMGSSLGKDTSVFLKEIYLKKYKNGQIVNEEKLSQDNINNNNRDYKDTSNTSETVMLEHAAVYHTKPSSEKLEYTSLVVKVIYSNGTTFEKEIYSR